MKTLIVTFLIFLNSFVFAQNYALKFGTNQYASINSNFGLGTISVTVEAWVNLPSTSESGHLVHIGNGAIAGDGYGIGVGGVDANGYHTTDGSGNELLILYDAVRWIATGVDIGTGWHHVAFSIDASGNCTVYLDGVSVYTESGGTAPNAPSNVAYIASGNGTDRTLTNGTIDEVRIWSVVLTNAEIRANMYVEIPGNSTNLAGYYAMSDGSGTTLTDNSSGSNSGTLVNNPSWVTSSAFYGPKNSLEFPNNDASTSLCVVDQNVTSNTDNWTMMAWFNPASLTDIGFNAIAYNGTDLGGYGFGLRGNQLEVLYGWAAWHSSLTTIPSTNRWYHVAIRRSGGTLQIFLDGKLLSYTSTTAPFTPEAKFSIGNMYDNTGSALYDDSFRGKIDEVSVWNTALTDAQIRDYMAKSLTGTETNLVAYYNFDNASGTTLPDFSGNGNDLTLTNMNSTTDWVSSSAFNTWLNTNSSAWSTAANWSSGSVPGSTDNVGVQSYTGGTDLSVSGDPVVANLVVPTGATLTLSSGITVTGNLILNSNIDLNGQGVSLSSGGTLIEGSGVFYGTSGYITTTRTLDGSATQIDEDVAGLGAHITTSANMGTTTIRRSHTVQTIGSNSSIKRYYDITPTNNTGLNATLVFNYAASELNGLFEPNMRLFKSTDTGTSWTNASGIVDVINNKVTLTGINDFSRWTLADYESIGLCPLSFHTIAVNIAGTVYDWGYNLYGGLGNGANTGSNVPVAVSTSGVLSGKTITQVAGGEIHSIALASDGTVYTWGYNNYGELGDGSNTNSNVPVAVSTSGVLSGKTIIQVAGGGFYSIALASDGTIYTWGDNTYGQLGDGTNTNSNVPVAVSTSGVLSGKTIIQVAAGLNHSIALASDGTVYAWGYNGAGQLGNASNTDSNVPVAVSTSGILSGKTIIQVVAGSNHSIALTSDGTVYTWGYNNHGELGNGSNINSNVPVTVSTSGVLSGKTIIQIAAGVFHSIALASDGTVYTWGNNGYGELGNNDASNTNSNVPVAVDVSGVLSGKTMTQVAAGYNHSIALGLDGTVYTWGRNDFGQLGNASNTDSNVPVAVDQSSIGPLPVELTSFTANAVEKSVLLSWQTATEVNNYGFEIQRSSSPLGTISNKQNSPSSRAESREREWIVLGFVEGHGNSNSPNDYSFTDKNVSSGKYSYRLKQIDVDGQYEYSDVVDVTIGAPSKFELSRNYPNPFNPTTTIRYAIPAAVAENNPSPNGINVTLKVYSILGEEVATLVNQKQVPGRYKAVFDASKLASGVYIYRIVAGDFVDTKKLMLLK